MTTEAPPLLSAPAEPARPAPARSRSGRDYARRWRGVLAIAGGLVVVSAVAVLNNGGVSAGGTMDPLSYGPEGARAMASLLTQQGVSVVRLNTLNAVTAAANKAAARGAATTVVVADPGGEAEDLSPLRGLPSGTTLVLVEPDADTLATVQPGVQIGGRLAVRTRQLDCTLPAAVVADAVVTGGDSYLDAGSAAGVSCYVGTLYQKGSGQGGSTIDIGSAATLSNSELGREGNAALGLGLLGTNRTVLWLVPGPVAITGTKTLDELLPKRLGYAETQALVAIGLLMLWRARRLGRVVPEPLPVVVRASETVEGQGRLYRAARSRRRAASALRAAALSRMAPRLGIRHDEGTAAMVDAVVTRTRRSPTDVTALLYGAQPENDQALVTLADQLDALEAEVRRS